MDVDAVIEQILTTYDVITVIGASTSLQKPAHYVPAHMQANGWRIIPVNPLADTVLGEPAYATLSEVPQPIGLVNVFRPSRAVPEIAREAIALGASALWLQLGIASVEGRTLCERAGLSYVEDRCLLVERQRLGLSAPMR